MMIIERFQKKLLAWFVKNQRPLPWRLHYRPYEVWVSEIMLQQTQVETVLPYYRRWMKSFPDIDTLANASEEKVLKLWEGLGYYSRARNLRQSARTIMEKFGGRFPEDHGEILSLKGVGRYTAGAISSIAFNREKPIVDGNVLRVLSRVYAIKKSIDIPSQREDFWRLQERLIPKGMARDFNQALMELGALVCSAQNPKCLLCPVRELCKAFKEGRPKDYPVRAKKKEPVKVQAAALILKNGDKYLIRKRPLGEIMGGLWEFPEWKLSQNGILPTGQVTKLLMQCTKRDFGNISDLKPMGMIKRNYTHHLETLHVFLAEISAASDCSSSGFEIASGHGVRRRRTSERFHRARIPRRGIRAAARGIIRGGVSSWPTKWATKKDFERYPFSSAHMKVAKLLR
jgi:A/G-specific adenine glycosylase